MIWVTTMGVLSLSITPRHLINSDYFAHRPPCLGWAKSGGFGDLVSRTPKPKTLVARGALPKRPAKEPSRRVARPINN